VSQRRNPCVKHLRRLILLSLATAAWPALLGAQVQPDATQDSAVEKEILAIETLKNNAMQKGDVKVLEPIYGDSLIFVNARGQVLTKQDRLKEFDSGSVKYQSFFQGAYRFHIYGSTAIVTGIACSVVDYHGRVNRIPRRFTSVYVKLDGQWRFVAHQATLASDEGSKTVSSCSN
jgi:ketosteroid isomerase-like protein